MADQPKKDEIKVEDRRHFDREGNVISSEQEPRSEVRNESTVAEEAGKGGSSTKIDFVSILFSYVHTALVHLGDLEDPIKRTTSENLEGARQMLDILELLQEKTKGNLDSREESYLAGALFDLRMRYMQKAKLIK